MAVGFYKKTVWSSACLKPVALLLMLVTITPATMAADKEPTPSQLVQHSVEMVVGIVKDRSLTPEERRQKLKDRIRLIVDDRFDFRSMSQSVMATHWQQASAYERDRFVDFFAQSLQNTYMEVIESYENEKIQFLSERIDGDRAVVDTEIVTDKTEIPVTYKMKRAGNSWRTYDVVIEGASLVNNYRNLYAQIINSSGVNGLLENMEGELSVAKNRKVTPGGLDLTLPE